MIRPENAVESSVVLSDSEADRGASPTKRGEKAETVAAGEEAGTVRTQAGERTAFDGLATGHQDRLLRRKPPRIRKEELISPRARTLQLTAAMNRSRINVQGTTGP